MRAAPIVLAAGGTGGHLFPAQALALELKRRGRRVCLFTDKRGGEFERRFPGVGVYSVPSGRYAGVGPMGRAKAGVAVGLGILVARQLLGTLDPALVVGFGGYPSLPPLLAALTLGTPTLIHEQNARLGRANRLLAPCVDGIATGFAELQGLAQSHRAKLRFTGNPVRDAVVAVRASTYTPPGADGPIRLLVLGGSQGATIFSDVAPQALAGLGQELKSRLVVSQQCRSEDLDRVRAIYFDSGIQSELSSFFEDVPARLAAAHLVIGRSGASTVSELAVAGRPAILVPYGAAADDHQTDNARQLEKAGGALMIAQARFTAAQLRSQLQELLANPARLAAMAKNAAAIGHPDATARLADLVETMAPGNGAVATMAAA
jgi:UDP-N-acetylglucosamine--N-acetylmuramyl-(pentapeptide) pyrophosphoryl-undecaprenol N-acetylglucosamine transferase